MKIALFTYGTLEIAEVMQLVAGQNFSSEPAILKDYVRYKLVAVEYPGIVRNSGSEVYGTVYYDIDEATLHKIDRYEDTCYKRQKVEVLLQNDNVIEAMAYIIEDDNINLLSDISWDKQKFIDNELERFIRSINAGQ